MAKDGPNWEAFLDWRLSLSDGASPSHRWSEEDRRWFIEAMQGNMNDEISRMREASQITKTPDHDIETRMLTFEDFTRIRTKAADFVTAIIQNSPLARSFVMETNGFEIFFARYIVKPDIIAEMKSIGALSSLVRHNEPEILASRLANGYAALRDYKISQGFELQLRALGFNWTILRESNSGRNIVGEFGFPWIAIHLARIMIQLVSNEDTEIREFALRGLNEIARDGSDNENLKRLGGVLDIKELLEGRIREITAMLPKGKSASDVDEAQLADCLWAKLYGAVCW
ncbi:PREDICTED: uncharacterized protein LOC104806556 [Tarenaya hassleriana]|uniref:uncharacterized protein LOC104806556 n=1 Tax=Tarenaya hassleriana TaxID=28532 RepID=UPI00053CA0A2|nr:PREDICTED: uncharacterized protein LOC104806556 [Tarenaya hassleriana]